MTKFLTSEDMIKVVQQIWDNYPAQPDIELGDVDLYKEWTKPDPAKVIEGEFEVVE